MDPVIAAARSHTLGDIPRRSARKFPDKTAIIDGDVVLTFVQFEHLVDRASAALQNNGFHPGDRIALLAHNCWQYAILAFATARAGVVLVPVNFMLTAEEIAAARAEIGETGGGINPPAKQLAQSIITTQQAEIDQMNAMLAKSR